MNRAEIIEGLKEIHDRFYAFTDYRETLEACLELLENENDLIDKVLKIIDKMPNANPSYWNKCDVVDREGLREEILALKEGEQE